MEPDIKDLLFLSDDGAGCCVGIYKGNVVRIGVGEESFSLPAHGIYSMLKFYMQAGFKLEPPSQEMLDAQRYRYLRNVALTHADDTDGPLVWMGSGDLFDFVKGADLDEAVDDALKNYA